MTTLRTFLHLLAVTVWVGGQISLAGIVPAVRKESPEATRAMATAFARIAWPAMFVIVVTGAWSLASVETSDRDTEWLVSLAVKLLLVGLAIAATLVHSIGKSKLAKAAGGGIALLGSLAAMVLGVMLAHTL